MKKDKLNIIYQDKDIIVVDKKPNILTVSTNNEKENTLFHKVLLYEKSKHKNNKVFIVHRLDKDTSGVMLFAKNYKIKELLQNNWDNIAITREYIAVVSGRVKENNGKIKSWLWEDKNHIVHSSDKKNDGKLAITNYEKIKSNKKYSLLKINILTGRKNQIRVHMKSISHPIIGDKKYDNLDNPIKRLALHATKLEIIHPITKQKMTFESKVPKSFLEMFQN